MRIPRYLSRLTRAETVVAEMVPEMSSDDAARAYFDEMLPNLLSPA